MRTLGCCVMSLVCFSVLVSCADDGNEVPADGGNAGTGGDDVTGGTDATGGTGGEGAATGAGGAPGDGCAVYDGFEMTIGKAAFPIPSVSEGAHPNDRDKMVIWAAEGLTGSHTFALTTSVVQCDSPGAVCIFLRSGSHQLMASAGTIEIEESTQYYLTATLHDVELIEMSDSGRGPMTPIPNGVCASIPSLAFHSEVPTPGWTCAPSYYDEFAVTGFDNEFCECDCGAFDPDCDNPDLGLWAANNVCADGYVCSADFDGCVPP